MENTGSQPGQTIAPAGPEAASPPPSALPPQPPVSAALSPPPPEDPASSLPAEPATPVPTGLEQPQDEADSANLGEITWTASEFVAHEKSSRWYGGLALVAVALAAIVYLIARDLISVSVVIFGSIIFGVYGTHQPRQVEYRLDAHGVDIGQKHYSYSQFRSFSIVPEGAFSSIVFMPLKRFATLTTIIFAPEDEDTIIALLSGSLPFEERGPDAVDRLMQRIRF